MRHGRTAWNVDGRFQGHTDIPLSEEGRGQARALARRLAAVQFDHVVSSDLSRAVETATAIMSDRLGEIVREPRLREIAFGAWEGLTWAQILEQYPAMNTISWTDPAGYIPEGGEAFAHVVARVGTVLDELCASEHRRVLIVTHAGPIHAVLSALFGEVEREHGLRLEPASLTHISIAQGVPKIRLLNDIKHL